MVTNFSSKHSFKFSVHAEKTLTKYLISYTNANIVQEIEKCGGFEKRSSKSDWNILIKAYFELEPFSKAEKFQWTMFMKGLHIALQKQVWIVLTICSRK